MKLGKLLALIMVIVLLVTLASGCAKDKEASKAPKPDASADDINDTDGKNTDKKTNKEEGNKEDNNKEDKTKGQTTKDADKDNDKSDNQSNDRKDTPSEQAKHEAGKFPIMTENDAPSIDGGVLKVALVASSPFAGVMNICFYEDNYDSQLLGWFAEAMINYDENFVADQEGVCTYEYDVDAKTITLHMREGVKWHDGETVTLDDLVFAYEVICHPDYQGLRYGESEINIVGVEEYHNGTADTITGLELSEDEMTLTMHFKDFYPSILVGGFWANPLPRHYFAGIEVKDMAAHEKSRSKPIGFGPFKLKNLVPGESVEFERFDDYWLGRPKLDGVVVEVVAPELVPTAMQEGRFDIAAFSVQQYPDYKNPTNYQYVGDVQTVFSYTGFKLGKWDAEKNENIYDPNSKMADVKLRQAIGYAIDNKTLGETLYNGLRFMATTIITPRHGSYQNKELEGYVYNPEKAKVLLDEAGYKDIDGDGFRESPNGEQFTITWATMDGENAETYAQFKLQCWAEVGLRVELYNGRLTEFNAFYEAVEADDPAIDMYDGAWQTGFDPNPVALWGRFSPANYTRYTDASFDKIIDDISSDKAWDNDFLIQRYRDWQEAFFEQAPVIPTLWRIELDAVNNRVKNYQYLSSDIKLTAHLIELTAKETIK